MRIVIIGGPKTGKTYLSAGFVHTPVRHTDDLIVHGDMQTQVRMAADWMNESGSWVIEGAMAVRALRAWMAAHPGVKPAEQVIYLQRPMAARTPQQTSMAKGIDTVWHEIEPLLQALGVNVRLP